MRGLKTLSADAVLRLLSELVSQVVFPSSTARNDKLELSLMLDFQLIGLDELSARSSAIKMVSQSVSC